MKKNKKISIRLAIIALIMALVVFIVLIVVEANILNKYEKTSVVITKDMVTSNTKINKNDFDKYFKEIEVPKDMVTSNTVQSLEELDSVVYTTNKLDSNEILQKKDISSEKSIMSLYKEPVLTSISVKNISDACSGTLRAGDKIDIVVFNNIGLITNVVLQDVYIKEAYTNTGEIVDISNELAATVFTIVIEKEDVETFIKETENATITIIKK